MRFTLAEAAHLLRRAAVRGRRADAELLVEKGLEGAVNYLLRTPVSPPGFNTRYTEKDHEAQYSDLLEHWLSWWLTTPTPAAERLLLFWQGYFTSEFRVVRNPWAMARQAQTLRVFGRGRFSKLLNAVAHDPAMLRYLDNAYSHKDLPNENWSRELLELYTLGVGRYTESDVREVARAFTGWSTHTPNRSDAQIAYLFRQDWHDPGPKKVLGRRVRGGLEVIQLLASRPEPYTRVARRLLEFYLMPNPPNDMLYRAIQLLRDEGTVEVLRWLFTHPTFYSPQARNSLIRSPIEYLIGLLSAANATRFRALYYKQALAGMGQLPFNPPTVKGWDGGSAWISETAMLTRLNLLPFFIELDTRIDLSVYMDGATRPEALLRPEAHLL
jgi:uncharacterized protein (DUF1800 family)